MHTIKDVAKKIGITRQGLDRRIKSLKIKPIYLNAKMRVLTDNDSQALSAFSVGSGRPKNKLK